jgi:hypothetical protein
MTFGAFGRQIEWALGIEPIWQELVMSDPLVGVMMQLMQVDYHGVTGQHGHTIDIYLLSGYQETRKDYRRLKTEGLVKDLSEIWDVLQFLIA